MNKTTLKKIRGLATKLQEIAEEIDTIKEDAEANFDLKSEQWQKGENGKLARERIDALESAYGEIDSALTALNDMAEEASE